MNNERIYIRGFYVMYGLQPVLTKTTLLGCYQRIALIVNMTFRRKELLLHFPDTSQTAKVN